MNHRLAYKNATENSFNPRPTPYVETNLIDLNDHVDLEATSTDPKEVYSEIEVLKKWGAEEEAKRIHLEKEKEQATVNALIERDNLLRRIVSLKEQNKKPEERTYVLHTNFFGDIDNLRSNIQEQEKLVSQRQEPVISQIEPYKPIQLDLVDLTIKPTNKGK